MSSSMTTCSSVTNQSQRCRCRGTNSFGGSSRNDESENSGEAMKPIVSQTTISSVRSPQDVRQRNHGFSSTNPLSNSSHHNDTNSIGALNFHKQLPQQRNGDYSKSRHVNGSNNKVSGSMTNSPTRPKSATKAFRSMGSLTDEMDIQPLAMFHKTIPISKIWNRILFRLTRASTYFIVGFMLVVIGSIGCSLSVQKAYFSTWVQHATESNSKQSNFYLGEWGSAMTYSFQNQKKQQSTNSMYLTNSHSNDQAANDGNIRGATFNNFLNRDEKEDKRKFGHITDDDQTGRHEEHKNSTVARSFVIRDDHSKTKYNTEKTRPAKRIIYIESNWTIDVWLKQRHTRSVESLRSNPNTTDDNEDEWEQQHYREGNSKDRGDTCVPKADWQTHSNPNCNNIHEIDFAIAASNVILTKNSSHHISYYVSKMDELSLLGEGWFRTTWRLDRTLPANNTKSHHHHRHHHHDVSKTVEESVVLKTLRIEREFLSEYYELHRRDAVAMERLTGSDFVVNVYGFCAQSAINELANFNFPGVQNLETFNRRLRGINTPKSAEIKLRMAASIALGLADIHAAGENANNKNDVFLVHYDMNPRNIALFAGGRPKINDFNIAEFIRYNPKTKKNCGFPSRLHEPWWRAPEEMNMNSTDEGVLVDEKVDVYALGNILYHTLTSHAVWGKMLKEKIPEVRPKVAKGIHPEIPKMYLEDKDGHIKAIVRAIKMCWEKDPAKRASAEEVATVLYEPLARDKGKRRDGNDLSITTTVHPPTDPNDDDEEGDAIEDKDAMGSHHRQQQD